MTISESKKKIVIDNYFINECDMNTTLKEAFTKGFELGLKKAPTPQPKMWYCDWIPVSDRLPEVGSEVLVCFDFKGKRSVYISHFYGDGEFHGLDDEYLTTEGRKYRKAVAWMPLPTAPNKLEIPTGEGEEK